MSNKIQRASNSLYLIDNENYILDGTLLAIDSLKGIQKGAILDEQSVIKTIERYKQEKIQKGLAYGALERKIETSLEDEISDEEVKKMMGFEKDFPILVQPFEEEEISEDEIAFQIIDMMYDQPNKRVFGRIQILSTPEGMKAREMIDQRKDCYISSSGVEDVVDRLRDKNMDRILNPANVGWKFVHRFQRFREGWKISFTGK